MHIWRVIAQICPPGSVTAGAEIGRDTDGNFHDLLEAEHGHA